MIYHWKSHIPAYIKLVECEVPKTQELGGDPLIWIIPQLSSHNNTAFKSRLVIIKMDISRDNYPKFMGRTGEDAACHLLLFWLLVDKLKIKANYTSWQKMKKAWQEELDSLVTSGEENNQEEVKEAIKECKSSMKSIKQEFWQLFEHLLDGTLVTGQKTIVVDKCDAAAHVAKKGIHTESKHSRTFDDMNACTYVWLLNVMKPNAAECHANYMQTQIRMPPRGLEIKLFVICLLEINGYVKFLSCQKDFEDSPAQFDCMDKPFPNLELCNIVLRAIPYPFTCAYQANKGSHHFPVDIKVITEDLALIKPEFKHTQHIVEKIQGGICAHNPKSSSEEKRRQTKG